MSDEGRKLRPHQLRWAAVIVALIAFLAYLGSNMGAELAGGIGQISIANARVGPVQLRLVLGTAAILIVGLLYLASSRSPRP